MIDGIYGTYTRLYLQLQVRRLQEHIFNSENMKNHIYKIIFTFANKKATRTHLQFGKHEQNTYTRLYLHLQTKRLQEHIFNLENMSKTHIQDYIYICKQEGYKNTSSIWETWTNHTRHVLQGKWDMGQLNEISCYLGL